MLRFSGLHRKECSKTVTYSLQNPQVSGLLKPFQNPFQRGSKFEQVKTSLDPTQSSGDAGNPSQREAKVGQ